MTARRLRDRAPSTARLLRGVSEPPNATPDPTGPGGTVRIHCCPQPLLRAKAGFYEARTAPQPRRCAGCVGKGAGVPAGAPSAPTPAAVAAPGACRPPQAVTIPCVGCGAGGTSSPARLGGERLGLLINVS